MTANQHREIKRDGRDLLLITPIPFAMTQDMSNGVDRAVLGPATAVASLLYAGWRFLTQDGDSSDL